MESKKLDWGVYRALNRGQKLVANDCFGNEFARLDFDAFTSQEEIEKFKSDAQVRYEKALRAVITAPVSQENTMTEVSELKPCPFCGDPMKHEHDAVGHIQQGDCVIGVNAWGGKNAVERWNRRAALAAALAAAPKPRVKALAWLKHPSAVAWRAETLLGTYQVWAVSATTTWLFDGFGGEKIDCQEKNIETAKAASQADYERRVLSALEDQP